MATKKQQERVNRWIARWKDRLLLDSWGITIGYKDADHTTQRDGDPTSAAAEIIVDQRYNEARINIYPLFFTRPVGYQESTIVHELLHIVTDNVRTGLDAASRKGAISEKRRDDILESVTEHFAKIAFKLAKRGRPQDNYHV